jgi:hypothetical protein
MTRETFDDAVARVASEITAAKHDPAFAARLRARLDEPRTPGSGRVAAVSIATLTIGLAIAAVMSTHEDQSRSDAPTTVAIAEADPPSVQTGAPEPRPVVRPAARSAAIARRAEHPAVHVASAVEMASAPPGLAVNDLQLEPLSVPPVSVADLDVAELSVAGLGIAEER